MQLLQTSSYLFTLPKTFANHPPSSSPLPHFHHRRPLLPLLLRTPPPFTPKSFSSDEFPVDENFIENFTPKDKETEDEARRRNWIDRGWAPWEEILTPKPISPENPSTKVKRSLSKPPKQSKPSRCLALTTARRKSRRWV